MVTIDGITGEQLVDAIAQRLINGGEYHAGLEDRVQEAVEARVRKLELAGIDAAIRDQVADQVREVIASGWPTTNSYGEPTGKVTTLKERIVSVLTERQGANYGHTNESLVEKLVREAVAGELGKALKVELDRAQAEIRAAVDGLIKERLAETLRASLGLGR